MGKFGGKTSVIAERLIREHEEKQREAELAGMETEKRDSLSEELQAMIPASDPHYEMQEFASDVDYCIKHKYPVALTGHCGTGKTSLIYEMAAKAGQPVIRVNANQQTTISDFVGHWAVKAGEMVWIDGALPYAMRNGCWLIIDEIDYAEPAILSALNAVLEPSRRLMLKEKGNEVVEAHEEFRVFATGNTLGQMQQYRSLYQGTTVMNEAFMDRWRLFKVDYLSQDLEIKVVTSSVSGMTKPMAKRLVEIANSVRKAFNEESLTCTFSTRRLLDWAEMIVVHKDKRQEAPFRAAESTIFAKVSAEDEQAIRGFMQRVFFSR